MKVMQANRGQGAVYTPSLAAKSDFAGIPRAQCTPSVRKAIASLKEQIRSLREELDRLHVRLEEASHAADQDQLLPILNRRAFARELTRHIALNARYGTPACLLYFDLDGFKQINDTHGHAGGDFVLAHFATVLKTSVRESDVVGRLGGDEFGILLSHVGPEQAAGKAADLQAGLAARPALWNGTQLPLSFSSGFYQPAPGDTAEIAIARADAAMYRHKRVTR